MTGSEKMDLNGDPCRKLRRKKGGSRKVKETFPSEEQRRESVKGEECSPCPRKGGLVVEPMTLEVRTVEGQTGTALRSLWDPVCSGMVARKAV